MESTIDINNSKIEKQPQNKFLNIKITSLVCTVILLEIIIGLFTDNLQIFLYGSKLPGIDALWEQFLCYVPVIIWLLFVFKKNDVHLRSFFGKRPISYDWKELLYLLPLLMIFALTLTCFIAALLGIISPTVIVDYMNLNPNLPQSYSKLSGITTGFHLLNTIILAPIIEELIFRGVMLHRWSLKWGLREAIFMSSILFGLLHMMNSIDAFLFGLVMCTLYLRTKTILVPIVFHILNNFCASIPTLFELINGNTTETLYTLADLQSLTPYLPSLLLIALTTGAFLIIYLKKHWIESIDALPEI